jgi:hypothetical protein
MYGRLRRWTVWLLPLLAVRLMVPAGFMLSLSDGGLALVLCSGSGPLPGVQARVGQHHSAFAPHAAHEHRLAAHDAPASHHTSLARGDTRTPAPVQTPGPTDHASMACPFALASGSGLCPFVRTVTEPPRLVTLHPRTSANAAWIAPAVLIDRIRGPPVA